MCFEMFDPKRETWDLSKIINSVVILCLLLWVATKVLWKAVFCDGNGPKIDLNRLWPFPRGGSSKRGKTRSRSWKRFYLRNKRLLHKKGVCKPTNKKEKAEFYHPTEEEEVQDKLDRFECYKSRYLQHSFVMFDLRFGTSLQEFVETVNPVKEFRILQALSNPRTLCTMKRKKPTTLANVWREVEKYRVNICSAVLRAETRSTSKIIPPLSIYINNKSPEYPIVIDSGASFSLTPKIEDFVSPIEPDETTLTGLNSTTLVAGTGIVEWTIQDVQGEVRKIKVKAFYVPQATIRLFSPQQYFQQDQRGSLFMDYEHTRLQLSCGTELVFPYNCCNSLPLMLTKQYFEQEVHVAGLSFEETSYLATSSALSVVDTTNLNLTSSQKELLLWHWKLGHIGMKWVQALSSVPRSVEVRSKPVIPSRTGSKMSSCERPLCTACQLSKQARRTRAGAKQRTGGKDMAIKAGSLKPGDSVSIDQYMSSFPGRLANSKGKEPKKLQYSGGTIFVDSASGLVHLSHQVSLKVGETLRAKKKFENYAKESGVQVKNYRADNVPFGTPEFLEDIKLNNQKIEFSGVGAHHQNGVAERAIGTITRLARTMLLQHAILWPDRADLKLWPFAMEHAVFLWNNLPKEDGALSPIEIFTGVKHDNYEHVARSHVWGCPVYVLDPKLQDGKKLPKWDPRARRGMYLGASTEHSSSTIARILNLRTGHVSPQFHLVFDDKFTTISNLENSGLVDPAHFDADKWETLVETGYELSIDPEDGNLPEIDDSWLSPNERMIRQERRKLRLSAPTAQTTPPSQSTPTETEIVENEEQLQIPQDTTPSSLRREVSDVSARERRLQRRVQFRDASDQESTTSQQEQSTDITNEEPPTESSEIRTRSGRVVKRPQNMRANRFGEWVNYTEAHYAKKIKTGIRDAEFLQGLKWTEFTNQLKSGAKGTLGTLLASLDQDYDSGTVESWDPRILAVKADAASAADNPSWEQAMNGPDRDGYFKAAEIEVDTLERMDTWEVVEREDWMNVLPTTWAFKCKRYPDGTIRKFKARFCARGDRQIEGVDFFETFAPVVNWTTVRLLLVVSIILGLKTCQADYTAAFVQAPIDQPPRVGQDD
jgi:hypothetical protein